jgi:preprotein translocase subunit SecG
MLQGPRARVIGPSIVEAFAGSGKTLTAAMALLQMAAVAIALVLMYFAARAGSRQDADEKI